MKEHPKNVFINFQNSAAYQFLFFALAITLIYAKTIYFDYCLDDGIIIDSLDGKVNCYSDLFSLFKMSYNNADYRPIVFLSFGIERLLFGEFSPAVSHAVNCILYFLICISALKLFKLLFDNEHNFILFFGVLLFCVHPINTEVVSSIKCRDNLLSMLFGLLSSVSYLRFHKEVKNQYYYLFIAFVFSFLSVLSKLDGFGFLIFNILYALLITKSKKFYFILASVLLFISINILNGYVRENLLIKNLDVSFTPKVTFTENPLALAFTIPNRIIAGINTVYFYFTKFTCISSSKYYYGYNYYDILSTKSISFIGGIIITTSFIFAFIYSFIKKKKIITISIIAIISTVVYALNYFTPVAGIIADRYIFIASLFFCLLAVYFVINLLNYFKIQKYTFTVIATIIIVFSVVSFLRVNAWKNLRTLIDTDAPKLCNSYEAMRIAASVYMGEYENTSDEQKKKEYQEKCIYYAQKGIAVYPKNYLLHQFLGQYYFKFNQIDNAKAHLYLSLENDTAKTSYFYLGDIYYSINNLDSALYYYQAALLRKPNLPVLINNISTIYFEKGEKERCLQFNFDLIQQDSTIYAAYENLGYYYLIEKDTLRAKNYFKQGEKFGLDPVKINSLK